MNTYRRMTAKFTRLEQTSSGYSTPFVSFEEDGRSVDAVEAIRVVGMGTRAGAHLAEYDRTRQCLCIHKRGQSLESYNDGQFKDRYERNEELSNQFFSENWGQRTKAPT